MVFTDFSVAIVASPFSVMPVRRNGPSCLVASAGLIRFPLGSPETRTSSPMSTLVVLLCLFRDSKLFFCLSWAIWMLARTFKNKVMKLGVGVWL